MRISNSLNNITTFNAYELDRCGDLDVKVNAMTNLIESIGAEAVIRASAKYVKVVISICNLEEIDRFIKQLNRLSVESAREFCEEVENLERKYSELRDLY